MTELAVIDDWQGIARECADWSALGARAQVRFFNQAFADEDEAAAKLADFDIVLSMRERTPLPASLIRRLPRLRMLGITGMKNASLDLQACTARSIVVCSTTFPPAASPPPRSWRWVCSWRSRTPFPPGTAVFAPDDFRKGYRRA